MDFLPTKGIEYLLVIGYLLTLVFFWRLLRQPTGEQPAAARISELTPRPRTLGSWFEVPDGYHFHRGHAWALAETGGVLKVGIDDFAQKLLGEPEALFLPRTGENLEQGEAAWGLKVDGQTIKMLSPVGGEILEVNEKALQNPEIVCQDPYGKGWLLKVRAKEAGTALKNLLPTRLAQTWTEQTVQQLNSLMGNDLGVVLQDGGVPVSGFARQLAGEEWPKIASQLLMTA